MKATKKERPGAWLKKLVRLPNDKARLEYLLRGDKSTRPVETDALRIARGFAMLKNPDFKTDKIDHWDGDGDDAAVTMRQWGDDLRSEYCRDAWIRVRNALENLDETFFQELADAIRQIKMAPAMDNHLAIEKPACREYLKESVKGGKMTRARIKAVADRLTGGPDDYRYESTLKTLERMLKAFQAVKDK